MTRSRQQVARWGEDSAARYLQQRGYTILARNLRFRHGELDVVARDGDTIVFVEVKTRSSDRLGAPQETVGARKQARIRMLADAYLSVRGHDGPCRFDVVAVRTFGAEEARIQHLVGVF